MTISTATEQILDCHISSLKEGLHTILSGCTKSNDIKSDANIAKIHQYTDGVLEQYSEVWTRISSELAVENFPEMIRSISIDKAKYNRVKGTERAINEREARLRELRNKMNHLRSTVPSELIK